MFYNDPSILDEAREIYNKTNQIRLPLLNAPMFINVTVLPCPLGLSLDDEDHFCECDSNLLDFVHSCSIKNGTGIVYRNGTTWIGVPHSDADAVILANKYCPFDYCQRGSVAVDLYNSDSQCAIGHSGILCGGCPPGLSLAIGSSHCVPCKDNRGVALFIAFIGAGIALVLFIKIFDLTVTQGTINGLIFYANVIWINEGVFFAGFSGLTENEEVDRNLINFLFTTKGFIAWLNLDLGIETCFIQGLDAYWKTWLQFVFPVYLWIIAGLIILVCRYSTGVTRFFGNNAVSVLATLFLMSYMKLLRTIVLVLGLAVLQQHDSESTKWVWLLDGNVPYFISHHAPLFLVAVFVLVFLCLPYTIILLFIGQLNKLPCPKFSQLVNKFKPLLDTYTGPLKDKHQYWVGLTLLVRALLAISAITFQAVNPTANKDIVVLSTVLLFIPLVKVYKKIYTFFLELSFFINLAVLSVAFLSTEDVKSRIVCTCISVSFSFLMFVGIVVYHTYLALKDRFSLSRNKNISTENTVVEKGQSSIELTAVSSPPTKQVVELREDLLEDSY